jgi:hypothetical protein
VLVDGFWAMADTERMTKVPNPLVLTLLQSAQSNGISLRGLADLIGISAGAISGWKHGANPGTHTLALTGLAMGLRLEAVPTQDGYSGLNEKLTPTEPPFCNWWGPSIWPFLPTDPVGSAWYLCALIGAEVHWNRAVVIGKSRLEIAGYNHAKIWSIVEQGVSIRRNQASIGRTSEIAGELNLDLVWVGISDPWRARPWQLQGAPVKPPNPRWKNPRPRH